MRAAIYCRISRDRVGAGLGVERQEGECRDLAARLNLTVVEVFVDNDLSAYSGKPRPAYKRMLAAIEAGHLDAVLVWHTDRLHRRPVELENYIIVCEQRDVPTYTVTAGVLDLTHPDGRMNARITGAVSRREVEHSIKRILSEKQQLAAAGKWGGGRRPYGYETDGVTIRPDEAKVVVDATDAILLGNSLRSEAAKLNATGLLTSTGRAWTSTELRKVIKRPRNAGLREHRGAIIGKAEWPPILAEEKWRAACSLLDDPTRRTTTGSARRWLLSGLATCGVCGAGLLVTLLTNMRERGSVPSYACKAGKCVVRNAAELEDFVSRIVVERLSRPDAVDLLQAASPGVDLKALRTDVATVRQRLDDLADNLDLDERTLARRSLKLRERLADLELQLSDAGRGSVLHGVVDVPDVAAAWSGLDLERRRAVISTLMDVRVDRTTKGRPRGWKPGQSYFDPRTITITWKA